MRQNKRERVTSLHKECLVRFDTVTLVQKRVDGKKVLFLTVEAPADDVRKKGRRRSPRRKESDRKRQKARRERIRLEKAASHLPSPAVQPSPPPPSVPDSPLRYFGNIPQLDGPADKSSSSPAAV